MSAALGGWRPDSAGEPGDRRPSVRLRGCRELLCVSQDPRPWRRPAMRAGLPAGMTADSGPAQPAEFASRLARALDGEAFGMALFTELAARRADADERAALQRLAALEAHMRLALEALMERC